ncbi:hypothetical protein AM629_18355 [Photorhabdus heterorhabditis]|uniref:Uncharacterized protein n=1 Tax=Photorhabdus heterorhabditis TaxID=880156 RepID=A0ABR5K7N7_9GAMM|nr:hypothetical protein AM629_18355 [Photorhabdus heterorhabditis]
MQRGFHLWFICWKIFQKLLITRIYSFVCGYNMAIIYPSSFKLLLCWLRSLAAALQFEIYWV